VKAPPPTATAAPPLTCPECTLVLHLRDPHTSLADAYTALLLHLRHGCGVGAAG